jgi:hypothetical protein
MADEGKYPQLITFQTLEQRAMRIEKSWRNEATPY